jgi:phosphonate transport system substrate-binding protein
MNRPLAAPLHLPAWLVGLRRVVFLLWLGLAPSPATARTDPPGSSIVRFGFSRSMFLDLNENDARAAVKVYATLLGTANQLIVDGSPGIFDNPTRIAEAFAEGTADVVAMPTQEYLAIPPGLASARLIAAKFAGSITEDYLLLVRDDSGITKLAELQGRRLLLSSGLRGSLAASWLDVLLAKAGLDPPARFFSNVGSANKPIRTVLPVFFRQEDACIVTRQGYQIMGELNPQVMKQMRVLATSPGFVPTVTIFRASLPPDLLKRIIKATIEAQDTVAGQQMLTIFQSGNVTEIEPEKLDSVRTLLADHARLCEKAKPKKSKSSR